MRVSVANKVGFSFRECQLPIIIDISFGECQLPERRSLTHYKHLCRLQRLGFCFRERVPVDSLGRKSEWMYHIWGERFFLVIWQLQSLF
ncbi:hypothetical protein AYI69_g5195 [Smittium culicis]|uniref:Uncharacterized protein n=1 Tax=Smittium culicis TaxID=133412 RepID=A0A1R1Y7R8_9FUNG|nr:hypothetical protein AYI69_g5195 [Smittium culicis]